MFKPVSSKAAFPQLEEQILRFWKEKRAFQRSVERRRGGPLYVLYDGPPTVNASPGIHHILSRVFKDIFPRYKTMKGYHAPRKAGWDTHGLPVELEVENELGLKSKPEIEAYGVAEFNQRCRQNVLKYKKEWEELTERIGFWIDLENAYITFDNGYIESCWHIIKQLWQKGLVYQGYKVTPHCPRCVTSLSSHEVALGYEEVDDPSVYIKFRIDPASVRRTQLHQALAEGKPAYLLAWTTTPWTLPGNTALAVAADADYSVMEGEEDYLVMASALVARVNPEGYREVGRVRGEHISGIDKGLRYQPLFNPHDYGIERSSFRITGGSGQDAFKGSLEVQEPSKDLTYPVISADFVSMEDGTGIVHIAPAFGEADFEAGRTTGLDFVRDYVDSQGIVQGGFPFAERFVKHADVMILEDLKKRGLLFRSERLRHTYPLCWRCSSPLLYYAKPSWYIRTTALKDRLLSGNEEIDWYPEHIKYGRFGDWLQNNVDWAFSRERYWGTPLPVWRCDSCQFEECVGSVDELKSKPGVQGVEDLVDIHRPYVDRVTFECSGCGRRMTRVIEVIDCWFDSGAMPFAQWHYPFENDALLEDGRFPADYISEAVDQTRGWFYSLHAISILLTGRPSFKNVICLGHILDSAGEKMSKSRGNVVRPAEVLESAGADALRWYLVTSSPPGNVRRFSRELVEEVVRKFTLTLWNTYSFFVTYANIDRFDPRAPTAPGELPELDRWIRSELNQLVEKVSSSLDSYDPTAAARRIDDFVQVLSNWYVRRSRRRFWKSENDEDKQAAYVTLHQCLVTLSRVLAPFMPFLAEELYQNLVASLDEGAPDSVHLTDFPQADLSQVDEELAADTRLAMLVSSLGRSVRAKANLKVRQPLGRVLVRVKTRAQKSGLERMAPQILEELNVKDLQAVDDPEKALPDWPSAEEAGLTVMLDTSLTPELIDEGMARELVHRLQFMRKSAGFDIADHIEVFYRGSQHIERVMENFARYIRQETLSENLVPGKPPAEAYVKSHSIDGNQALLGVRRVEAGKN
ncbi:MAG: isoleucine--tRNA ligase [Dehalococcoidia bacterium]|nr:isoleucine--tRNA ligase [Dehalococcoidia bacterium]